MRSTPHTTEGGRFLSVDTPPESMFTREDVTDEQRMLADTAAEFMRKEVLPVEARLFAHDWTLTRALLKKAASLDLLGVEVPEQYGGMALSKVSGALILEQIAVHPSFGASLGVHAAIGSMPIVYFGTDAQKATYLPKLVSGEWIGAYALTESGSGSDARAARTTATLTADGRHYVLNGQKIWISNGGFADLFTVFAKINGDQFTAFIVERGMGVVSGPEEKKLGLDGSSTTTINLDQIKVPVENVLGQIGEGHKVAFNILNIGRVRLGARNMAAAREALRHAARYAAERRQFGRPIADFGLIKEKLADMAVRCVVADAMVFRTLGDVDRALAAVDTSSPAESMKAIETFATECSVNKVFTSEALAFITDEAIQVFGGNGYSREFPVERLYRDARITRIYEGTNEINRLLIATRLLKSTAARGEQRTSSEASPLRVTLGALKDLAVALFDSVRDTYGQSVREQQEVLGRLANIAIDIFALESVINRAEKAQGRPGGAMIGRMAEVFAADAVPRVATAAATVRATLDSRGSERASQTLQAVRALELPDTIPSRRAIADAVVQSGGALDGLV